MQRKRLAHKKNFKKKACFSFHLPLKDAFPKIVPLKPTVGELQHFTVDLIVRTPSCAYISYGEDPYENKASDRDSRAIFI
ncbi:hypothetical protein CANARDRAFT_27568 [[Candida] arabinofermentans NRRL YB-2248]|uniref:Uncharacterized protein n=1 Tax=[Candida] arabinofermentans NRRL YB-2248 TaxID=983967 RepID=A0A1E4T3U7_9ASCO|nr:hypothetical protein CANARDRAFT_27568 [[Candida] arabinofermentans NRRL YB-2248]